MEIAPTQFPNQRLTEAEKITQYGSIEAWGAAVVQSLIGIGSQVHYLSYDDTYRKQINYNLVAGSINPDDFKYVTKPYGLTEFSFPANFVNYNIITPKVSLLEGEEASRPFNFRVTAVDRDSTSEMLRHKTEMMHQVFKQAIMEELKLKGVNVDDPKEVEAATPQDVEKYFKYSYKAGKEISAANALEYLQQSLNLKEKFQIGWRDLLITGEEIYYVGQRWGEPDVEVINPVYFQYDKNPNLRYIQDAAWAYYEYFMPAPDVYDMLGDKLTEQQVELIEQMKGGRSGNTVTSSSIGVPIRYTAVDDGGGSSHTVLDSTVFVHVIHCEWKGLKKLGFVSWVDENGQEQTMEVDEKYKVNKFNGETIEWKWITTVYEATRIGADMFVNVREKPNQYRSLENPSKCKLGYVGVCYNARNSQSYSLVEVMKPHQYLYDIIMYRLELEIARAQGKKMVFDIAQIPASEGFDVDRWLYYFNVMGIAFVNSFEEGKGKFAGQTPTFNQFQAIDMSLARVIDQYVMMLTKIEDMIGEISGVSKQREGTIGTSETVGGVERSVRQSSYITEPLFMAHNTCKQDVLTALLNCAQLAWSEGKTLNYVKDDLSRVLMQIDGTEMCNADLGVFVTNSAKEEKILSAIEQLAAQAMQAKQATLMDVVAVLESGNVAKAKAILQESYDKAEQQMQAQMQAEQQAAQQQMQATMQIEQGKMQAQDAMNVRDNETKIQVALIGAESKEQQGGTDPVLEEFKVREELRLKEQKLSDDRAAKQRELYHKETLANKEHDSNKNLSKEELDHTKNVDHKDIDEKKKIEEKKINEQSKAEKARIELDRQLGIQKLNMEREIAQKKLAVEREIANKKAAVEKKMADEKIALEKEKMAKEHERKQEEFPETQKTKIAVEKIKAKSPNNKPKQ
jgi:hypothetical protein